MGDADLGIGRDHYTLGEVLEKTLPECGIRFIKITKISI